MDTSATYHQSIITLLQTRCQDPYICHETISANRKTNQISDITLRSAFIKPHRFTNYVFNFNKHKIIVIDRVKNTAYGVMKTRGYKAIIPKDSRITCLERALIDAVVNPHYNGGISSVYSFFKHARKKLDIAKLLQIYTQLEYIYPYSQSIGFLLDKSGIEKNASALYAKFPSTRPFFVDHSAKSTWSYDDKWKLYYPKGLIDED